MRGERSRAAEREEAEREEGRRVGGATEEDWQE